MRVYIDHTHLWRHVTGLERITLQLFSKEALAPLETVPITASRMSGMLLTQNLGLAGYLMRSPSSLLLCPGFPPAPVLHLFGTRVIPYIHDVFLLSRRNDLNWRAKAYLAWPFGLAVRHLPRFLVNTNDTAAKLRQYCREDADITIYRPGTDNNFKLTPGARAVRATQPGTIRLVALGTVEPRKNLLAAAAIVAALRQQGFADATLEVIGRRGWGNDWETLSAAPGVVLHGYQSDKDAAAILDRADVLISTSHEEGLGLPLLEAQFAGLPIVAPDQPVFREVLDRSGMFIDPGKPRAAAEAIAALVNMEGWRAAHVTAAADNLRRWNDLAVSDRNRVIEMLSRLGDRGHAGASAARNVS